MHRCWSYDHIWDFHQDARNISLAEMKFAGAPVVGPVESAAQSLRAMIGVGAAMGASRGGRPFSQGPMAL